MATILEDFGPAFGGQVRALREAAGATQDQLARAIGRAGITWSRARVAQVEAGEGVPDLVSMTAVAVALQQLSGTPVRLIDLLPDSDSEPIRALRHNLSGEPVRGLAPAPDMIGTLPDPRRAPGWEQVEDRVAAQLPAGVDGLIMEVAQRLYGRGGSAERDVRAGQGASAQKRGYAARAVIAELVAAVQAELEGNARHDTKLDC